MLSGRTDRTRNTKARSNFFDDAIDSITRLLGQAAYSCQVEIASLVRGGIHLSNRCFEAASICIKV